jgi:hypothetical protein
MDDDRLRLRVRKIAESVKNVRFNELLSLLDNHVQPYCQARGLPYAHNNPRGSHHGFTVGSRTFNVVTPHGRSLVNRWYVQDFLEAMEEIGLLEE